MINSNIILVAIAIYAASAVSFIMLRLSVNQNADPFLIGLVAIMVSIFAGFIFEKARRKIYEDRTGEILSPFFFFSFFSLFSGMLIIFY